MERPALTVEVDMSDVDALIEKLAAIEPLLEKIESIVPIHMQPGDRICIRLKDDFAAKITNEMVQEMKHLADQFFGAEANVGIFVGIEEINVVREEPSV